VREEQPLEVGAAAEATDQVPNAEGNCSSRVGALLDRCTQDVFGLADPFVDGFGGAGRGLLGLAVDVLQSTLHLLCLALELGLYVAGCASKSLFHLAAKILGAIGKAVISHGHVPSQIWTFNRRD
jgi:hypothetical protein